MKVKASDLCIDARMEFLLVKEVMASKVQQRAFNYTPELSDHLERCKKCREMLPVYQDLMQSSVKNIQQSKKL